MRRSGEGAALAIVLILAAWLRLLWVRWFPMPPESDFATFLDMARAIARGQWLPDSYGWVYQGVGYPTLIAPLVWLGGGPDVLRLVNVCAQLATIVGVWLLARRLFGPRGGLAAAVLAAISPGLWSFVPLLAAESVAMALLVGVALLLTSPAPAPVWWSGATGLLMGALALTRPSFLPFVLLAALAMLVMGRTNRWRRLLLFGAGLVLVAAPVMTLNRVNDGPLLPIGASGWQTWLVNNEHATGAWFDAGADDAYPFTGLVGDAETRSAQSRLGRQFVVANPIAAVEGAIDRYRRNWQTDAMGIGWTFDRAPDDWQGRVPFADRLHDTVPILYLGLLLLASAGAIRNRTKTALLLPLVLPLAYAMAILATAEANGRYHAVFVPLLCVMAGGAFVPTGRRGRVQPVGPESHRQAAVRAFAWVPSWPRRALKVALVAVLVIEALALLVVAGPGGALWDRLLVDLPPLLIAVAVVVPLVGCTLATIQRHWTAVLQRAARPSRTALAAAGLAVVLVVVAPVWVTGAIIERTDAELAAVSPTGWTRTEIAASPALLTGPEASAPVATGPLPLILVDSGTPPELRQVSFPDAALLSFDATPNFGDVVQLTRTLPDLRVGQHYVFYLQVYDPGTDGDVTSQLRITLDGAVVWERLPGRITPSGWQYVRLDWTADATSLDLAVAYVAGWRYRADTIAIPRVRTLHLYPRY